MAVRNVRWVRGITIPKELANRCVELEIDAKDERDVQTKITRRVLRENISYPRCIVLSIDRVTNKCKSRHASFSII